MRRVLWCLALAACGGIAVVDPPGAGQGGNGGSGNSGNEGGQPLCSTDTPVGVLTFCGGSVTSGTGASGAECAEDLCDEAGHIWESLCDGSGCRCNFDSVLRCSCSFTEPGQFCFGGRSCCPAPFP